MAIYMKVELDGEGMDSYKVVQPNGGRAYAEWHYQSLKGKNAFEFLQLHPNDPVAAAFAAQMKHPINQRPFLKAETMRVILDGQLNYEELTALLEAVDYGLKLDDNLKKEFDKIRNSDPIYRKEVWSRRLKGFGSTKFVTPTPFTGSSLT